MSGVEQLHYLSWLLYQGLPYLTASNGAEALDVLDNNRRPSLVLLDMRMPVVDGWASCARSASAVWSCP